MIIAKGNQPLFLRSLRSWRLEVCARSWLLLFGLAGVIWSAITLPAFRSAAPAKDATARILADDRFKSATLSDLLELMLASPEPIVQRSDLPRAETLVRVRIAEEAIRRQDPAQADRDAAAANERLKFTLALNPADSFLWLMLYSLEITRSGFDNRTAGFLDQSYASGPLEGWISLRRNSLALAAFHNLSEASQAAVVSEFAAMVDSDFTEAAARNLMDVGWEQRDRLLGSLANVELIPREAFAKKLSREGLKVSVPGVYLDERLWR
ncbi:hypothetical protein SAMN05216330_110207 [Bradyrhizobium sp. Ghvi]|uniref:hypothetical protein n=1 Tax=Bradyrhizobium sp. Ghvi TaxID=1855319 RepID=UPI0008EC00D8|nr:hypothetical protein [Bradyrhizobium sp. Ghvi]SFP81299.1 hypothetical protein SAMN05216330_110207 [Bradyrhizobium sp. Ghvi]